jgi:group I intron endonuclease
MKLREPSIDFCVYKITNLVNGKIYIGKTSDADERWEKHLKIARNKEDKAYQYLHKSINKYGEDNFKVEVLDNGLTEKIAFEREEFWIRTFDSQNDNIGMNLTAGGEGATGLKWTEVSRDKIRGENNHNFGKEITPEVKAKLSAALSGENNPFYGKTHSDKTIEFLANREVAEEIREIISLGCRGEKQWNAKFSDNDILEIRRKWDNKECSQAELGRQYGVKRNTINQIVNRKRWTHI